MMYIANPNIRQIVSEGDLFFEVKEDDRGKYYYRKIIADQRSFIQDDTGYRANAAKHTGKWHHEDDFAVKFINGSKVKIFLVEYDYGLEIKEVYIPGTGWRHSYDALALLAA